MAKIKLEKPSATITWGQSDKDKFIEIKNANGPQEIGQDENGDPILEDIAVYRPRQIKAVKMEMLARIIKTASELRNEIEGISDKQIADLQAQKAARQNMDETNDATL